MSHLSIFLQRISSTKKGTIGRVTIPSTFEGVKFPLVFHSLEPATPALSVGTHKCVYAWSNKFNQHMCFVEDKEHVGIMFHKGNFVTHTKGCVLLGSNSHDYTLLGSASAVNKFNEVILPFISNKDNILQLIVKKS